MILVNHQKMEKRVFKIRFNKIIKKWANRNQKKGLKLYLNNNKIILKDRNNWMKKY